MRSVDSLTLGACIRASSYVSWDYEGWTPVMDSFLWSPYKKLCGEDNGTAFNAAAKAYYLKTLEVAKSLRPKAKFGFYGMPLGKYGNGGYFSPGEAQSLRAHNDRMDWLWKAVDFFAPELYLDLSSALLFRQDPPVHDYYSSFPD